jgi:hypothetical protein
LSKFTLEEYRRALQSGGFRISHEWLPDKKSAVFIVAEKS